MTPNTKHQAISLRIAAALLLHAETRNLGRVLQAPCDVILSRDCIVQPDIVFFSKGRSGLIGEKNLRGAPDLIVEIVSAQTREDDLRAKRGLYSRFEVKEYWTADPDSKTVEVLVWSELGYATAGVYDNSDRLSSPALPELRLPLRSVFKPC